MSSPSVLSEDRKFQSSNTAWLGLSSDQLPFRSSPRVTSLKQKMVIVLLSGLRSFTSVLRALCQGQSQKPNIRTKRCWQRSYHLGNYKTFSALSKPGTWDTDLYIYIFSIISHRGTKQLEKRYLGVVQK